MSKPKILLISDVKGWGGWERGLKIQEHLSDEFDIELVDQLEFRDSVEGYVSFESSDVNLFKRLKNSGRSRINIDTFAEWIRKGKGKMFQIGNFDLYYLLFHILLLSKEGEKIIREKKRVLAACTGYPIIRPKWHGGFGKLLRDCSAISANNMKSHRAAKIYNEKVFYIPRGVDPELFFPNTTYDNNREFTVVFVGKKGSGKGLERFIQPACEKVGARLIVNDRNYTNALPKDDMRELYNKAHVYVVASETDGTPNPALEAAACGRPIISNEIGNMPEFIRDGFNGFMIERDIDQIANRLKWIKDHLPESELLGLNARQTILDGWTWEHSMEYERKAIKGVL